jgi:alpha-amylase
MRRGLRCSAVLSVALVLLSSLLCASVFCVHGASLAEWKQRTIYQLLTDRFARSDNSSTPCADLDTYCGGTFDGIVAHLDYIANLGFDAVWISPVPLNQPDEYHGYAAKDLTKINPHFGGEAGLKRLSDALHERGMLLMVDVVANHMGIPPHYDFSDVVPFNSSSHYHSCAGCPDAIPGQKCWIQNFQNRTETQLCRLDGLPDLDQSVPFVRQQLLDWVKSLVARYGIDGLRIDTVPEVGPPEEFWGSFQSAANVYAVGEVFDGNVEFVASFQSKGKTKLLDGLLSYPLYFALQSAFGSQRSSLVALGDLFDAYAQNFEDPDALGSFVENHDNPRFLVDCPDVQLYRSAIVYAFYSPVSVFPEGTGFYEVRCVPVSR